MPVSQIPSGALAKTWFIRPGRAVIVGPLTPQLFTMYFKMENIEKKDNYKNAIITIDRK
jgi:hypothetical protein